MEAALAREDELICAGISDHFDTTTSLIIASPSSKLPASDAQH